MSYNLAKFKPLIFQQLEIDEKQNKKIDFRPTVQVP